MTDKYGLTIRETIELLRRLPDQDMPLGIIIKGNDVVTFVDGVLDRNMKEVIK